MSITDELAATGIAVVPRAVAREQTDAMVDAIWEIYAVRGVLRDDPSTWPTDAFQVKLQALRKTGAFKPFANDTVGDAITSVLGEPWHELDPWGAPLITFPVPGPWVMPRKVWHSDFPAKGSPDLVDALRMFGFVSDVAPEGGGTLVIEGSHELIRRRVAAAPDNDAGNSNVVKRKLFKEHPWFAAPSFEPTDIEGVTVRVRELTGEAGDVVFMLPWTLHNISMNVSDRPRFMVTHTAYRAGAASVDE